MPTLYPGCPPPTHCTLRFSMRQQSPSCWRYYRPTQAQRRRRGDFVTRTTEATLRSMHAYFLLSDFGDMRNIVDTVPSASVSLSHFHKAQRSAEVLVAGGSINKSTYLCAEGGIARIRKRKIRSGTCVTSFGSRPRISHAHCDG